MVKNFKQFLFIAGLIFLAAGAKPVGAAIWQWSTTASTNASADPSINWAENMAPSSVNDSARAMMAAIAAWRNDISGVNVTAGTSTAYTLTTSEGVPTTPFNGQMISFIAHVTNGASPAIVVDGGTSFPIWLNGSAVGAGSMVGGAPYRMAFSTSNNAWLLEGGPSNPYNTPLGGLIWTTLSTAPNSNFASANGGCLSTTTYNAYWVALGSPAPAGGCGGGTFQIIDLRGRVVAGLDTLPGSSAANRMTSNANGCGTAFTTMGAVCANGTESWTLTIAQMPNHQHVNTLNDPGHTHTYSLWPTTTAIVGAANFSQPTGSSSALTGSSVTGISITNAFTGGGGAHPSVQPTMGLYPWVRVL